MSATARNLLAALVLVWGGTAWGQQPPVAAPTAASELARINDTLERIADALAQQTKLDILARRIQLAGTRLADGEKRAVSLYDERSALEAEQQRLAMMREKLDAVGAEAVDIPAREREAAIGQLDAELARVGARLRDIAGQVSELESRLARQRVDLDEWQAYLDRLLSGL